MKKNLLITIFFCLFTLAHAQTLLEAVNLPNNTFFNNGYGLVFANGKYWISSGSSTAGRGVIYAVNSAGSVVDSIIVQGYPSLQYSQGLAYDGTNFWYVERKTARCDLFKISPSGVVLDSIPIATAGGTTSWILGGAAWDGTGLWVSLYSPDASVALYKINTTTKTIVDTIPSLQLQPTGITIKGDTLFYVNDGFQGVDKIYAVSRTTKDTLFSFNPPETPGQRQNPRGLAWDGAHFWLLAEPVGATSGRQLFKYNLGGGGTPQISVPIKFFNFGNVILGTASQQSASISNLGNGPLRIDSVRTLYSTKFTTNLSTPFTIQAGQTHNFTITFQPTTFGDDSAHILIYHNDVARGVQTIRVVGKGIFSSGIINVPTSYNFGTRRVGSTSLWYLKIDNQGSQPLTIFSASFSTPSFYLEAGTLPITISPVSSRYIKVWFKPLSTVSISDTMRIQSTASNSPEAKIALLGMGDATPVTLGNPIWNYTVPLHPISNTSRNVKGVRAIGDITGDGKADIIVCTENYWTVALNGNSSGSAGNDTLWSFNTYISSSSAGSIGTAGDYSYQKALQIASDLNGDGFNDVVIGTGGGNETVYAINGKTGAMLWKFGTDHPDSFALGDITGVDVARDFNGDGIPDVVAAASATQTGGVGGRRSAYLFNGANGQIIWQSFLGGFTHGIISIPDVNNDNIPDVVATVGEPVYQAVGLNGANGTYLWTYPLAGSSSGAKEVMHLPVPGQKPNVVVSGFWGPIVRLNAQTGALVWTRAIGSNAVTQFARLRDFTGDGIDEILASILVGGSMCLNGATGEIIWSLSTGNTMGVTAVPDVDGDGIDDGAFAVQYTGTLILKGNTGAQIAMYTFGGTIQTREVALVPDINGDGASEIVAGSNQSNVVLISGGAGVPSAAVVVNSPNGGESWSVFSTQNIIWNSSNVSSVKIEYSTNNGSNWILIASNVPAADGIYFWKLPNITSTQCRVKVSDASNPAVSDLSDNTFSIVNQQAGVQFPILSGWNIISVPINRADMSKNSLFPNSTSQAYGYNNGYFTVDTLITASGYWLKFDSGGMLLLNGSIGGLNTIAVKTGWNMIGVNHLSFATNSITSSPSGIISSLYYGYENAYTVADTLRAGRGYWIKVSQNGTLNLPTTLIKSAELEMRSAELEMRSAELEMRSAEFDKFNKIIISDNDGNKTTLYLSNNEINLSRYELPPVPPSGVFDARFTSDRFVENINNGSKEITINTFEYPIKIKVEGMQIRLKDLVNGKLVDAVLKNGEEVVVENSKLNKFSIESIELPSSFQLYQNYPNPFNPSTTIEFRIPHSAFITLKVYDVLGREVATVVDDYLAAGIYRAEFDASKLSAGIYFYKIETGSLSKIKKMIILR